jgi:hypothetical protein
LGHELGYINLAIKQATLLASPVYYFTTTQDPSFHSGRLRRSTTLPLYYAI